MIRGTRLLIGVAFLAALVSAILWFSRDQSQPPLVEKEAGIPAQTSPQPEQGESNPPPESPTPSVEPLGDSRYRVGEVEFDKKARTLTIPAAVLMHEGAVEYLLVTKKGKVHESVFVTDAEPQHIHLAALLLGIKPSPELGPTDTTLRVPQSAALQAAVEWDRNGPPAKIHLHEALATTDAGDDSNPKPAPATLWLYNGSRIQQDGTFVAQREGSIISIIRDSEALINYPDVTRDNDDIHIPHKSVLPKLEHPVRIVLKLR